MVEVQASHSVKTLLDELPETLISLGYKSNKDTAKQFVNDIFDFMRDLPFTLHHRIKPQFAHHFIRYGNPTHYAFFKRKSSPNTTWYIFFSKKGNRILVKHIATNWTEGQYIR